MPLQYLHSRTLLPLVFPSLDMSFIFSLCCLIFITRISDLLPFQLPRWCHQVTIAISHIVWNDTFAIVNKTTIHIQPLLMSLLPDTGAYFVKAFRIDSVIILIKCKLFVSCTENSAAKGPNLNGLRPLKSVFQIKLLPYHFNGPNCSSPAVLLSSCTLVTKTTHVKLRSVQLLLWFLFILKLGSPSSFDQEQLFSFWFFFS